MQAIDHRTITLPSGVRLDYAECGKGPATLFLHGYTDSWRSFEPVLTRPALTPRARCGVAAPHAHRARIARRGLASTHPWSIGLHVHAGLFGHNHQHAWSAQ